MEAFNEQNSRTFNPLQPKRTVRSSFDLTRLFRTVNKYMLVYPLPSLVVYLGKSVQYGTYFLGLGFNSGCKGLNSDGKLSH